jgi:TonB family protein
MNLAITNNNNFNLTAVFAALALHLTIIALNFLPSTPTIIQRQAIQISFVAPSSKQENSSFQQKIINEQALIKVEKKQEKIASGRETSGITAQDATATNSAQTDAIFDAAYLNNPAPHYPLIAKKRGIQGKVLLEVLVSEKGEALNVKIFESSGSSILDGEAFKTVKNWRFVPAKKAGREIASVVLVPIEFKIV